MELRSRKTGATLEENSALGQVVHIYITTTSERTQPSSMAESVATGLAKPVLHSIDLPSSETGKLRHGTTSAMDTWGASRRAPGQYDVTETAIVQIPGNETEISFESSLTSQAPISALRVLTIF